jgi:hypothetical protein
VKQLIRTLAVCVLAACAISGPANAQVQVNVSGMLLRPMTPEDAAKGQMVANNTRFFRPDDGPRYVAIDSLIKNKVLPGVSAATMRKWLDEFAKDAPKIGCRTDDVGDAYEIAIEMSMALFNGTHFKFFQGGPISCTAGSWGVVQLNANVHIVMGGQLAKKTSLQKQAIYEAIIIVTSYLADAADKAKGNPKELAEVRQNCSDLIKSIYGVRAERIHFTDQGVSIDDQYRP